MSVKPAIQNVPMRGLTPENVFICEMIYRVAEKSSAGPDAPIVGKL